MGATRMGASRIDRDALLASRWFFRDEMLGVLGVPPGSIAEEEFGWLLMFANQAASAIANARAFSELDRLRQQLESHNAYLKEEVDNVLNFGSIVGRSSALRHVLQQVDDVAATDATVLITGESGTGKELLAKEIHERGRRSRRPFVRVNCSAIPREMFESEFFGHVRGAFTGALRDRPGRFQVADGGTIFWMRSAICPWTCSQSSCACYRRASTSASARTSRETWMCA